MLLECSILTRLAPCWKVRRRGAKLVCAADRLRRRKSLASDLVSRQHIRVDLRPEPGRNHKLACNERQRFRKQPDLRLQKSVELAGIADGDARDASLHPAAELAGKSIAEHGLHS